MNLSTNEYRLIAAIAKIPVAMTWTRIERSCGMRADAAKLARAGLRSAGVLLVTEHRQADVRGYRYNRTLYALNERAPIVREIRAWLAAGCVTPPPYNPDPMPVIPEMRRVRSGRDVPHEDRLLEAILRNPGASWRALRASCRTGGPQADLARADLIAGGVCEFDAGKTHMRDGRVRTKTILVPVETHPRVRHMRAELKIPYAPIPEPVRAAVPRNWRDELRDALKLPPSPEFSLPQNGESALKGALRIG